MEAPRDHMLLMLPRPPACSVVDMGFKRHREDVESDDDQNMKVFVANPELRTSEYPASARITYAGSAFIDARGDVYTFAKTASTCHRFRARYHFITPQLYSCFSTDHKSEVSTTSDYATAAPQLKC